MSASPAKKKMKQEALDAALSVMTDAANPALYDVTIVCTTDDHQAAYWTKRLSEGVCHSPSSADDSSPFPLVLAVSEDWSAGGAGNGLGTLYAYTKAAKVAQDRHGVDLDAQLREGKISAALYHTAGKGTRLAPLPASENNNKPGVVSSNWLGGSGLLCTYWDNFAHKSCDTPVIDCGIAIAMALQ